MRQWRSAAEVHSHHESRTLKRWRIVDTLWTDQPLMPDSRSVSLCMPADFESLARSRRDWIENVLRVWCRQATLNELRKADVEWFDIAGRADANATLWTWAWERFPEIVHPQLPGVHETYEVRVTLHDGHILSGFPDARQSLRGILILVGPDESGAIVVSHPISIDQITAVAKL